MKKLTKSQVAACNIIDTLLHHKANDTQSYDDLSLVLYANQQLEEYQKTGDVNCLKIMKEYTKQLYNIFNEAYKDWNE